MAQEIRYRVLVTDPVVKEWAATRRDGTNFVGKATAAEIVESLKAELGEDSFDPNRTLEWLEAQDPADAGDGALLPLNSDLELEAIVKRS
ncbi:MAG TPA: hypothetical protein VFZ19_12385 [Solirubrobacterales bacterium]